MKRKNKKNQELSNEVFELGISIALAPLNFLLRSLPYFYGVSASIIAIIVWCMPVILTFSLVSNTIFTIEIAIKLLRK